MKNFASASFFRLFDHHVRPPALSVDDPQWTIDGVDWTRSRHSFRNCDYGQTTEVFVGIQRGRKPWRIMVVRETWWVGSKQDAARSGHWAQLVSGDRASALAWFKAREDFGRLSLAAAHAEIAQRPVPLAPRS